MKRIFTTRVVSVSKKNCSSSSETMEILDKGLGNEVDKVLNSFQEDEDVFSINFSTIIEGDWMRSSVCIISVRFEDA